MNNQKNNNKKLISIFFIFLLFPSFVLAGDDINLIFHVNNNLMVDVYYNIFNGIVMLLSDSTYLSILKIVFLIGGFFVFMMGIAKVFSGGDAKAPIFDFLKYMIIGVIMLSVLFNGKTETILIRSDTIPTYCQVLDPNDKMNILNISLQMTKSASSSESSGEVLVGNIPEVLAFSYVLMNRIGTDMTQLASAYFSLPGGFQPPMDGFVSFLAPLGETISLTFDKIVANTNSSSSTDSNSSINLDPSQVPYLVNTIVQDCVLNPASGDSTTGPQVISTVKDTGKPFMTIHNLIQNGDLYTYKNPDDTNGTLLLSGVKANDIEYKDIMANFFGKTYSCGELETRLYKIYTDTDKLQVACIPGAISKYMTPKALAVLAGTDSGGLPGPNRFREIALNAALMNTVYNTSAKLGLGSLYFTQGKTIGEFVQSSLGSGYYMAQLLPFMQMALRAILYAFFPFVFIVALFPGGLKVLLSYAQTVLWIELWAPTAAILNFFLSYVSASDLQNMYNSGFNAMTATQVFSDSAILASVAGYLYASVPALTWLILKGSGYMLGNITGAIGSRFAANLSNVDAYNKDIAEMKALNTYNKEALARDMKTISLAEANQLEANKMMQEHYGNIMRLAEFNDKEMFQSGYGERGLKIASGLGGRKLIKSDIITLADGKYIDSKGKVVATENAINQISKELGISKDEAIEYISKMKGTKEYSDIMKKVSSGEALSEEDMTKLREGYKNQEYKDIGKTKAFSTVSKETAETSGGGSGISELLSGVQTYYERKTYNLMHGAKANDNEFFLHNYGKEYAAAKVADEWIHHSGLFKALGMKMNKNNLYNYGDVVNATAMLNKMGDGETLNLLKKSVGIKEFGERALSEVKELRKLHGDKLDLGNGKVVDLAAMEKRLTKLQKNGFKDLQGKDVKDIITMNASLEGMKSGMDKGMVKALVDSGADIDKLNQDLGAILGKKEEAKVFASSLNKFGAAREKIKETFMANAEKLGYESTDEGYNKFLQDMSNGKINDQGYAFIQKAKAELSTMPDLWNKVKENMVIQGMMDKGLTPEVLAKAEVASKIFKTYGHDNLVYQINEFAFSHEAKKHGIRYDSATGNYTDLNGNALSMNDTRVKETIKAANKDLKAVYTGLAAGKMGKEVKDIMKLIPKPLRKEIEKFFHLRNKK